MKDCKCNQNPLRTRRDENGRYIVSGGSIRGERILYARVSYGPIHLYVWMYTYNVLLIFTLS